MKNLTEILEIHENVSNVGTVSHMYIQHIWYLFNLNFLVKFWIKFVLLWYSEWNNKKQSVQNSL